MSYEQAGIIPAPVSFNAVNGALGTRHTDLGNLCKDSNINVWAKYKPVVNNIINISSQFDYTTNEWKSTANWFHGSGGRTFGMTPYTTTNFANIITNTVGGMNGWSYTPPTGGSSSPYRLSDFVGYHHNAPPIAGGFSVPDKQQPQRECWINASFAQAGQTNVALGDFNANLYFGFAFVKNGSVAYHGTGDTPLQDTIRLTSFALTAYGTYDVYPFLCTEAITPTTNSMGNHTYWTIPMLSSAQCEVASSTSGFVVSAEWFGRTSVKVHISNGSGSTKSANIYVRRVGRNWGTAAYRDEGDYASNPASVPSDGAVHTYRVSAGSTDYNYHAMVVVDGHTYDVGISNNLPIIE